MDEMKSYNLRWENELLSTERDGGAGQSQIR